jgi:hypothetical protein
MAGRRGCAVTQRRGPEEAEHVAGEILGAVQERRGCDAAEARRLADIDGLAVMAGNGRQQARREILPSRSEMLRQKPADRGVAEQQETGGIVAHFPGLAGRRPAKRLRPQLWHLQLNARVNLPMS